MKQQELRFPGFPEKPYENYWQYPKMMNGYWHQLSGTEQKVLDYILRHTWGYQKSSDKISISQFKNGIVNKRTGEVVDRGIGIKKRDSILNAIKRLEKLGFVKVFQVSGKTKEISLVTNGYQPSHQRGLVASHQRGHTIDNVTINNRQYRSSSKKKPYYGNEEMRFSRGKWWVLPNDGGEWLEFAGKEEDITYN